MVELLHPVQTDWANAFSLAASVKISCFKKGANDHFQINLGSQSYQRLRLHQQSWMEVVFFWFFFKPVLIYFSCLGGCYNPVLLWSIRNVLWTSNTSHHFTTSWWWADNDEIFIFGWTFSLTWSVKGSTQNQQLNPRNYKKKCAIQFVINLLLPSFSSPTRICDMTEHVHLTTAVK